MFFRQLDQKKADDTPLAVSTLARILVLDVETRRRKEHHVLRDDEAVMILEKTALPARKEN